MVRTLPIKLLTRLLSAALVVGGVVEGMAQDPPPSMRPPSLSGKVTDGHQTPVADAMVAAQDQSTGQMIPAKTDAHGQYLIPALPPGSFRVSVTKPGHTTAAVSTILIMGEIGHLDFTLRPGAIEEVKTSVAGKGAPRAAAETPHAVYVAKREEMEQRRPSSIINALRRALVTSRENNPAVQLPLMRGLGAARIVTLADGQRLSSPALPLPTISFPPFLLEEVEVVPGSGSTLNGSGAVAGTINLVTKRPARTNTGQILDLEIDGLYHSNGDNRLGAASLTYSNSKFAVKFGATLSRQGSYHSGNQEITTADVLTIGRFFTALGNSPSLYPIWSLPAGAEVVNGAAHSFGDSVTFWFYPVPKHSFNYTQLNLQSKDLGIPFSRPPYSNLDQYQSFLRIDKYSMRYEGDRLSRLVHKVSAGFYWQKFVFPNNQLTYGIIPGSSFTEGGNRPPGADPFTGNPSAFTLGSFVENKFSIASYSPDVQVVLGPAPGLTITTGASYVNEDAIGEASFQIYDRSVPVPRPLLPVPEFVYQNGAVFAQAEYDRVKWLRLTAGLRIDNWKTNGKVGGGITVVRSANTTASRSLGAVLRLKDGTNPYVRWSTSFRQPSIGEHIEARVAGGGGGNNPLKPEAGTDIEFGFKTQRHYKRISLNVSLAYFRNHIDNFYAGDQLFRGDVGGTSAASQGAVGVKSSGGPLSITRQTPPGGLPMNLNEVLIHGVEGSYQISIPLGRHGSISPFGSMHWLKGTNETPTALQLQLIRLFYNRGDTPIRLEGSPDDVPQPLIVPFKGLFGAKYADAHGKVTAEYDLRRSGRVTRVDPLELLSRPIQLYGPSVFYGTFASFSPFTLHSVRGSYTFRAEEYRLIFSVGVENLTNRLYWEPFNFAPAPGPGRSVILGFSMNFSNFWRK